MCCGVESDYPASVPQVSLQLMEVVKHLEEVRHQALEAVERHLAQEVVVEANGLVLHQQS
jgi:hypothetical protein